MARKLTALQRRELMVAQDGGWQAEARWDQRVYHYIKSDSFSLCGHLGFYTGEVTDGGLDEPGRGSDCKACEKRRVKLVEWRDREVDSAHG